MIHITQGHEKSISTEILIKSLLKFSQEKLDNILLHFSKKTITENLHSLNINFQINQNEIIIQNKKITFSFLDNSSLSESMASLKQAISISGKNDILITMPTSKDQFSEQDKQYQGHTDYFRKELSADATMLFKYKNTYCLLLTDHIPLNKVSEISNEDFFKRTQSSINTIKEKFSFNGEIYISGINPHAGEGGLIGTEEENLQKELSLLTSTHKFTNIEFLPGDTIHYLHDSNKEQLFIYFHHDQALSFFKNTFGLFGINITLNLPFLRFSVDHGTAFNLYNKNSANFLGTYYVINEALKIDGK